MSLEAWKRRRLRLLIALGVMVLLLGGVYGFETWSKRAESPSAGTSTEAGIAPPANQDEARKLLMKEVESGRENRNPGPLAFVFWDPSPAPSNPCSLGCLDLPVAEGLDVILFTMDGKPLRAKTGRPTLWENGSDMGTATPLVFDPDTDAQVAELAFFSAKTPSFEWIDLKSRERAPDAAEIARVAKDERLKDTLIEISSRAEGTLILTEAIQPYPPEESVIPTPEGMVTLRTNRWIEPKDNNTTPVVKRGHTEFRLGQGKFERLMDNGLLCSEVPVAFRLNGQSYILLREWGCDSDLDCRGLLQWEKNAFKMVYGSCRSPN